MGKKWIVLSVVVVLLSALAVYAMNNVLSQKRNITAADIVNYVDSGEKAEYYWNQKVTLTLETAKGSFSGSSVMLITWRKNTHIINDSVWKPHIYGYAPFVDVPGSVAVFSTMIGNDEETGNEAFYANALPERFGGINEETIKNISICTPCQSFIMTADSPFLISYSDVTDYSSATRASNIIASKVVIEVGSRSQIDLSPVVRALPWMTYDRSRLLEQGNSEIEKNNGSRKVISRSSIMREMR